MGEKRGDDSRDLLAVQKVLRGDPEAFEVIVVKYRKQLLHLAISYLGNEEAAEDAVQEIFLKVYRSLHRFSLSRRFHPWLYTIAVNHLKTSHIFKRRNESFSIMESDSFFDENYPNPEELFEKKEEILRIRRAVSRLPLKIRGPFILYYYEEMKVGEIAEVFSISSENVKSRLFRGRKVIRKTLTDHATGTGL